MCPKIDVMERECKKLEFEVHLNKALVAFGASFFSRLVSAVGGPPRSYNLGRRSCSRSYACRGSQIARCLLVYYAQGALIKSHAADLASGQASQASKGYNACSLPILLSFCCKQRLVCASAVSEWSQ
jgi:hypothetical protein